MPFASFYAGRRVLVTGDTGFKGSWLCEWLEMLGAEIHGIGLEPDTDPALFDVLGLGDRIDHHTVDVRDAATLSQTVSAIRPHIVFHLAAQSLVRRSYAHPLETLDTNVMGTANLLAAVGAARRSDGSIPPVVVVTSDKCYENAETGRAFTETDPMGGSDIYSASKGAAELVAAAWRRSFLKDAGGALATCRAGNVIGGGDWAEDRIVPDFVRAVHSASAVTIRNPASVRPWQHVLEPLSGYLLIGSLLEVSPIAGGGWNFGPSPESARTVAELVDTLIATWGEGEWNAPPQSDGPAEAALLRLSIDKAAAELDWTPVWGFERTAEATAEWYRRAGATTPAEAADLTRDQIKAYQRDANQAGLPWAQDA